MNKFTALFIMLLAGICQGQPLPKGGLIDFDAAPASSDKFIDFDAMPKSPQNAPAAKPKYHDSFVPDAPSAPVSQNKPLAGAVANTPSAKTDNQPTSPATIYQGVLQAGFFAYVLALIIAFATSKQSSGLLQSKPIKGGLSFFCGVLICLGPIFSLGQLEIDRQ